MKRGSIWEFCDRVGDIRDASGMSQFLTVETSQLGYEKFAFFSFMPGDTTVWNCSDTLPLETYVKERAFTRDPILHRAEGSITPVSWNTHRWDRPLPRSEKSVLSLLRDLNIASGVSIPIHGPGLRFSVLCLSTQDRQDDAQRVRGELEGALQLLGAYVATYYQDSGAANQSVSLTAREIDCLSWTSEGKTAWEIGQILSISERTVRFHLSNAMRKLDAATKHQAVLKALTVGLLH